MLEWTPILQQGAEALVRPLTDAAVAYASKSLKTRSPYPKLNFTAHIQYAYDRCTQVKTLVNPDRPVALLESYVNLSYQCGEHVIDEYDLIEEIFAKKRVVISSTGGGGKSMFMRYLWISCSVQPRGKIPLFIELRKINEFQNVDFNTFLFHSCASSTAGDAREIFFQALREGQFCLAIRN